MMQFATRTPLSKFPCSSFYRRHRRRLSTTDATNSVTEKSTDDKAEELGVQMLKWVRKNALIVLPTTFLTILTVDIVNNEVHRDAIERRFPQYVAFVREYYGFKGEDLVEKKRLKCLEEFAKMKFDVEVQLGDGLVVSLPNQSAQMSIVDLVKQASGSNSKDYFEINHIYNSDVVRFPDEDKIIVETGVEEPGGPPTHLSEEELAFNNPKVTPLPCLLDSLWNLDRIANIETKYDNYGAYITGGINVYLQKGNYQLPSLQKHFNNVRRESVNRRSNNSEAHKIYALERIQVLEGEIKELESQRRSGMRDTDAIDEEIRQHKHEITGLLRTYVNWFYYF